MRNSLKLLNLRKKLNAFHAILLYFTIIIFIFFTLLIGAFTHALPLTEYSSVKQTLSIHNNKNVMEYIKQGKDIPSDVNFPLYMKRFKLVTVRNETGKEIIICDTVTGYKWRHVNPSSYAGYYTAYQRIK